MPLRGNPEPKRLLAASGIVDAAGIHLSCLSGAHSRIRSAVARAYVVWLTAVILCALTVRNHSLIFLVILVELLGQTLQTGHATESTRCRKFARVSNAC